MKIKVVVINLVRAAVLISVLAACATPTTQAPAPTAAPPPTVAPTVAPAPTTAPTTAPTAMAASPKIYYADARTWPSEPEKLAHLTRGKFYIPVQDEGLVVVIDPEKKDPIVKTIKISATQPHHPWVTPGMRYVYINHQSEGKGDHKIMTVIDTFTDEVVAQITTDFDDPFHCSFSPTQDLFLCGDLNAKGGYVYYLDPINHKMIKKVKTNGHTARDVIQSHDGKFAFVGHQGDGNVDILNIADAKIVKTLDCKLCGRMKMTPDGKYLFASSPPNDFTAIIDVEKQEIVKTLKFDKNMGPGNINFAMNGKFAMIGLGKGGKLALVDVAKQEIASILTSGAGTNTAYANPAMPNLAIATNDQNDDWYTVVDVATQKVVEKIEAGGKATHNVQWSADGRFGVGSDRLGDTVTLFRLNKDAGKIEKIASVKVGFGTNGVQWTPYFCGVQFLTPDNVKSVKNTAATNANGDCASN